MHRRKKIIVNKIPLSSRARNIYQPSFERMPNLYLELIENPNKVQQRLINKDYVPEHGISDDSQHHEELEHDDSSLSDDSNNYYSEQTNNDYDDNDDDDEHNNTDIDSKSFNSSSNDSNSNLSNRLKQLLSDEPTKKYTTSIPRSIHRSMNRSSSSKQYKYSNTNTAPTLSELEDKGQFQRKKQFPNLDYDDFTNNDDNEKRELLFKFDLLKKKYKNSHIPDFTIHTDLNTMSKVYDSTLRRLSLDSSVENYKNYLIGGFMLVEFILGNWLKFDMQGFTQQQIINMNSYEKLLIELGEKSYIPGGSKWPVEVRLIFLIIINAAFFTVSKLITKASGANILNMINSMNTANNLPKKRKMRGPNLDFDEMPDIEM